MEPERTSFPPMSPAMARRAVLVACALLSLCLSVLTLPAKAQDEFLSGQFLVAEPGMPDPRFAETVILMITHDSSGALGLIVNRRVGVMAIADLLAEMDRPPEGASGSIRLHFGGPVQPELGFILHSADRIPEGSNPVGTDFAVSSEPDLLARLGDGNGPKNSLFALGYAGWGPGQLESEMQRKDWFTAPADPELVFTDEPAKTWQQVMDRRGLDL